MRWVGITRVFEKLPPPAALVEPDVV